MEIGQTCTKCSNTGKIKVQANLYCPRCFSVITIRRISKHLRDTGKISKNANILVLSKVTEHILKIIIKSIPINITVMELKSFNIDEMSEDIYSNQKLLDFIKENKIEATILPWTLDNELGTIWTEITEKKENSTTQSDNFVKLFLPILNNELIELARYYNIPLENANKIKPKDELSETDKLFEDFEDRYLGAKFGFYKSIKELRELE